jgi:predicted branched-subunit amino acid permease
VIVLTAMAINVRLLFYGAAIAPRWRATSARWRALAAAVLVDGTFAVGMAAYDDPSCAAPHAHYLGGATAVAAVWFSAIAAGIALGAQVPAALGLGVVAPLFLTGELVTRASTRPAVVAALAGGAVALAAGSLPHHLGIVAGLAAGVTAALACEEATS